MKKALLTSISLIVFTIFISGIGASCCKKKTDTIYVSDIYGLWEGTFTAVSGYQFNGQSYYFSLSVYKNGTCSFKSGTVDPNYFVYGAGTWSLANNTFSFTCRTLNSAGGNQVDVTGTASYDKPAEALTNGNLSTVTPPATATWRMNKVK